MPDLLEEAKRLSEVEALAREFHAIYQAEAKRQGDVRHHDDYDALPENIKEFDRVLARRVLEREAELVERLAQERKEKWATRDRVSDWLCDQGFPDEYAQSLLASWFPALAAQQREVEAR